METPASLNDLQRTTLAIVLAGGRGTRLGPLTEQTRETGRSFRRQIPDHRLRAVQLPELGHPPHRGRHAVQGALAVAPSAARLGVPARRIQRVHRHLAGAAARGGEHWYRGTADAVFQNLDIIRSIAPKYVIVLAGDHIYKMDYTRMVADHVESGADCTVGCIEVPRMEAVAFGVMHVDENRRVTGFLEKPADPPAMPGTPDIALASMGIYVFNAEYLYPLLEENICGVDTDHDFGKDIIPRVVTRAGDRASVRHVVRDVGNRTCEPYWRDVGTIDAYWAANLDLASTIPTLDLYDRNWPIWTYQEQLPPAKFVRDLNGLQGAGNNLIVCGGCVISGSQISRSVLSSEVRVNSFCNINEAVLLPQVTVGAELPAAEGRDRPRLQRSRRAR